MFNLDLEANTTLKAVADLVGRTRNWRPALNEAAFYMEGKTKERIGKQVAPDGTPWAPLAKSTIAAKKLRGSPLQALIDRGILVAGIAAQPASDTQSSVRATAGAEYAGIMQYGSKPYKIRPKKKPYLTFLTEDGWRRVKEINHPGVPARPYLGFSDEDVAAIDRIFKRHVDGDL